MRALNVLSGVVLLGVAVAVSLGAVELSLGSLRSPGPGLYPLLLGVVLGVLALALCAGAAGRRAGAEPGAPLVSPHARSVAAAVGALLAYAALLPLAGYPAATVLLLGALFRIGGARTWPRAWVLAAIFTAGTALLAYLLGIALPRGLMFPAG